MLIYVYDERQRDRWISYIEHFYYLEQLWKHEINRFYWTIKSLSLIYCSFWHFSFSWHIFHAAIGNAFFYERKWRKKIAILLQKNMVEFWMIELRRKNKENMAFQGLLMHFYCYVVNVSSNFNLARIF